MIRLLIPTFMLILSCSGNSVQEQVVSKVIDSKALNKIIGEKKDLQLIDVRTPSEYQAGHLKGATLIDYYKSDFRSKLDQLDKTKPVAVYCAVGGRSNETLKILKSLGFKEVYDLKGGIQAWQRAQLPIER